VTIDFLKTMISLSRFFCSRAGMFLGAKNFQKSLDGDLCVNCFITKTEFSMMCVNVCFLSSASLSRFKKKNTEQDARSSLKTTFSLSRLIRCACTYIHVCFSFCIRINYTPRDGVLNALLISLYYVSNASVVQTRWVIELARLAVFALSGFHVKLAVDGVWTHREVLRWEVPIVASVSVLRR